MASPALEWQTRVEGHLELVRVRLDDELAGLAARWAKIHSGSGPGFGADPVQAIAALVNNGGKRLRPQLVHLGWVCAGSAEDDPRYADVVQAAVALELLHTFAVIHDDVMDESLTRRGKPTVHEAFAGAHRGAGGAGDSTRFGESIAILAGDLAHAEADRIAAALPGPMREVWQAMALELVSGQLGDVTGSAATHHDLDFALEVARQKSGGYTVARPLELGATAAGASQMALDVLAEYGRLAGEAFALRDDLLGVFGDASVTGKPADDDLRSGKPTVLLALARTRLPAAAQRLLDSSVSLNDMELAQLRRAMVDADVPGEVETMIDERICAATGVLDPDLLSFEGIVGLTDLLQRLTRRVR